jgi:hypothetical protein
VDFRDLVTFAAGTIYRIGSESDSKEEKLFLMSTFFKLFCLTLALAVACSAQILSNLQNEANQMQWCVGPACAGGVSTPSNYTVSEGTAPDGTPSVLEFSETGGEYADALAYFNNGATSANYFMDDIWFYIDSAAFDVADDLEFDNYVYTIPYRWMFGSHCLLNGDWYGWNDNTKSWIDAKIPCKLNLGWNHLTQWSHRTKALTCSGMPCSHQDTWEINGQVYQVNLVTPASNLPVNWQDASGAQVEIDTNSKGGTLTVWYNDWNFTELGH